jgi:hypothetical protein
MHLVIYEITPSRIVPSLIAGVLAGASLVTLWSIFGTALNAGIYYVLNYGALAFFYTFVVALVVWAVGLMIFGFPIWWLLHKLGLRHWLIAIFVGGALSFLVGLAIDTRLFELLPPPADFNYSAGDSGGPTIVANRLTPHGWNAALLSALQLSVGGALVALVIWRVAYRSADYQAKS